MKQQNLTEKLDEGLPTLMITSQRHIGLELRIFTNDLKQLDAIISDLRQQFTGIVEEYKREVEEIPEFSDIQIHIVSPQTCPNCKQTWQNCQCGKPNRSPLV